MSEEQNQETAPPTLHQRLCQIDKKRRALKTEAMKRFILDHVLIVKAVKEPAETAVPAPEADPLNIIEGNAMTLREVDVFAERSFDRLDRVGRSEEGFNPYVGAGAGRDEDEDLYPSADPRSTAGFGGAFSRRGQGLIGGSAQCYARITAEGYFWDTFLPQRMMKAQEQNECNVEIMLGKGMGLLNELTEATPGLQYAAGDILDAAKKQFQKLVHTKFGGPFKVDLINRPSFIGFNLRWGIVDNADDD